MRVRCYLRSYRVGSITDVVRITGIARGVISQLERGHLLPRAAQVPLLQRAYGDPVLWYPAGVLAALAPDIRKCPGCGLELPPEASTRRIYHDDACRRRAGRNGHGPHA